MQLPEILLPYLVLIVPHCHPSDLSYYYVVLLYGAHGWNWSSEGVTGDTRYQIAATPHPHPCVWFFILKCAYLYKLHIRYTVQVHTKSKIKIRPLFAKNTLSDTL